MGDSAVWTGNVSQGLRSQASSVRWDFSEVTGSWGAVSSLGSSMGGVITEAGENCRRYLLKEVGH